MIDEKLVNQILEITVPYIKPIAFEDYLHKILTQHGLTLKKVDNNDGVVFSSGVYHIFRGNERKKEYENMIGKLFSVYGMSHELYQDLSAKLTVLRTLTHTLSILAASVPDKSEVGKIVATIKRETGVKDLILALHDERANVIYFPQYLSLAYIEQIINRSVLGDIKTQMLDDLIIHPHSYATDDGIYFIGLVTSKYEDMRIEPELMNLLLHVLIPFLRSLYLSDIASHDALTGLLTRRKLMDSLNMLWNLSKYTDTNIGILMCDIDHFKYVNDTYGHDVGDKVLETVASVIRESAPKGAIVGRYGGEEFVVAMNVSGVAQLRKYGEIIRLSVKERKIEKDENSLNVTISIGGAIGNPKNINDIGKLLKRADTNLYHAKEEGRDMVIIK